MIRPYVIIAALIAALAGGAWIVMLQMENSALTVENDRLSREVAVQRDIAEQAKLARAVEAAHREREAARAAELQRGIEALLIGDLTNADSPIDPRIGAYLDCVRRAEGGDAARCADSLGRPAHPGADQ